MTIELQQEKDVATTTATTPAETTPAETTTDAPPVETPSDGPRRPAPLADATANTVRNCTADHVIVRAGPHCLHLSPLADMIVDEATISAFALQDLSDQHVTDLSTTAGGTGSVESGAIVGIGFWAVIGYFIGLGAIDSQPAKTVFAIGVPAAALLIGLIVVAVLKKRVADVTLGLSLIVVFVLGVGVPVAVAIRFGDLTDLWSEDRAAEFFGRLSQTLLIVLAALLPTVLYFIFDRQRALTIRRTFQQQILRLDPHVDTLYDIDAKYGDFLFEAIGRDAVGKTSANRANPYPIFLASLLIVLGWLLVLPVVDDVPGAASDETIAAYLAPQQATYVFGFLGAYFFSINLIGRRYVRGDLRPKAYGTIAVRIITVFILSWMLDVAFAPADWIYVAAFLVGIVPETFFTLIAEGRRAVIGRVLKDMREPHPLTRLEGIDLYDRSRLQDEGVNNVEALAHHDLVDLMLGTRIPVPRLVDWVDQAILYLHTVDERGEALGRDHLRRCGIRTASDLIAAHENDQLWAELIESDPVPPARRLDLVHAAIVDDEWVASVLAWRRAAPPAERSFDAVDGQAILRTASRSDRGVSEVGDTGLDPMTSTV